MTVRLSVISLDIRGVDIKWCFMSVVNAFIFIFMRGWVLICWCEVRGSLWINGDGHIVGMFVLL